jgi:protein arginine N-methyltransferase 3
MGYCLLFEAMLDSVLWARDRYLKADGLMVPSHATLRIAPLADSELVHEHISFWNSIYGFSMSGMRAPAYEEAHVRIVKPAAIAAESAVFLQLPLHTITTDELTFVKEFSVTLSDDVDSLDAWVVWFDIFFLTSRDSKLPANPIPSKMRKEEIVAFTTGPFGPDTHWQQGIFFVNRENKSGVPLKKGQVIEGKIGFRKKQDKSRLLDINIEWDATGVEAGQQEWSLQ